MKKKKVSSNGRRKKKVSSKKPPRARGTHHPWGQPTEAVDEKLAESALRGVATLRAELDQHKIRVAKNDVDHERFAKEVVLRLEKLEMGKSPIIQELSESKSPAEEAGDFSSEFKEALTDAASEGPTPRGQKLRHIAVGWTEVKDGKFEEWASARIEELWNAMQERIQWESDANHELRAINQKVRDEVRENVLKPPDGCEIVVRSSR